VEDVKKPTVEFNKTSKSHPSKKEAKSPEVSKPVEPKTEKSNDTLTYQRKTVGGSEDDNTVTKELKVENTELTDKVKEVEFSQSTTQARLTELETESSSVVTAEAPEPTVTTETAPPTELTSTASKEQAATTQTVTGEKPAEDKSEEAQEETADEPRGTVAKAVNPAVTEPSDAAAAIKRKPVGEDKLATEAPAQSVAEPKKTETGPTLELGGRRTALKDIEPAIKVITELNMKRSKRTQDNQAAQVPKTFSQMGQFLTENDDAITGRAFAVNPDHIGLMSDGTKAPNMPEPIARTVDKPQSIEPCANTAKASMTSYKARKMAGTRTDAPEVAREVTKREDVTKTAVSQPKDERDPESDFPSSGPRRRFVGPPDKLPMTTTASNRKVQYVQPIRTRKPDDIKQGEDDKFYESTANDKNWPMSQTYIIAEGEVTIKSLLFVSNSQPSRQFDKYGQTAENIKMYVVRVVITDDSKGMVDSDDLPQNDSRFKRGQRRQLENVTEEEDPGDRQDDRIRDDRHQKFTLPTHEITYPVNATCLSIAVGKKNHGFKACLIQKAVEEPSLFVKAYKGDVSELFDEAYKNYVANKSATDMAVMMYNTATLKSAYSPKNTVNVAQQIDIDEMVDEEGEVTDEKPQEEHDDQNRDNQYKDVTNVTREEGEIAPLDALYPTMRVSSDGEKNKTYRENRMSAMHESTYQEDVKNKAYMENVDVPGTVATNSSSNYGPMTGTKDNTKRLAVITIASEGGPGGHN
jgi:hypothetical protein